jgi:two-component system OmpR family sensor kinase
VSHELRTPIARLEFALEMLRVKAGDPALEQRIVAMEGDVAELKALVDELLGMRGSTAGKPCSWPASTWPARC